VILRLRRGCSVPRTGGRGRGGAARQHGSGGEAEQPEDRRRLSVIMTFMVEPAKLQMNWARAGGSSTLRAAARSRDRARGGS
jgi:hypothetical protein